MMIRQWIKDLTSSDRDLGCRAIEALKQLGPDARDAVPALIAALKKAQDEPDHGRQVRAISSALRAIGSDARDAVPFLAPFVPLVPPDVDAEGWSEDDPAHAILWIGGEASFERLAARSLLLYPLEVRSFISNVLLDDERLLRQRADRIKPCLADLLTDSDAKCRALAARGLARYGSEAKAFVSPLIVALNDPSEEVRIQAAKTLAAVDPERKSEAIEKEKVSGTFFIPQ
jgi:HEAT repeat protein